MKISTADGNLFVSLPAIAEQFCIPYTKWRRDNYHELKALGLCKIQIYGLIYYDQITGLMVVPEKNLEKVEELAKTYLSVITGNRDVETPEIVSPRYRETVKTILENYEA